MVSTFLFYSVVLGRKDREDREDQVDRVDQVDQVDQVEEESMDGISCCLP